MSGLQVSGSIDVLLLIFRCTLGVMILLHGRNHLWGPGGVEGTARWFASIGFRPARVHALMSGLVELAVGIGLILGLLTPIACAALIGTMVVAGWAAHRPNGFFIFKDGYEYVLIVGVSALALATFGPGRISVDSMLGVVAYRHLAAPGLLGETGAAIAGIGGLLGGALLLAVGWRPVRDES
jgi:putative oxidoreductase